MIKLYPTISPYIEYFLEPDLIHKIYVEECGNPKGIPILFIHGGPGTGIDPDCRRFFDPNVYRVILFDQRGCGKSTPHGELKDNTSQNLIADMELIRNHCGINRWILFGGSWGSTLALLYAIHYPQHVAGMILRGIFLCRLKDLAWFYGVNGAARIQPEAWQELTASLPNVTDSVIEPFYSLLHSDNELAIMSAAKSWSKWEATCCNITPNQSLIDKFTSPHTAISVAKIETHYFKNLMFYPDNFILDNIEKISEIPGYIIHGRYDLVCPVDNAVLLSKAWPKAELQIIGASGHTASESFICDALIRATKKAAKFK